MLKVNLSLDQNSIGLERQENIVLLRLSLDTCSLSMSMVLMSLIWKEERRTLSTSHVDMEDSVRLTI